MHARSLPAEQRTIPLSEIAARTKLGADGVEFLLMKTLSLKLIEGVIDQVDSTVQASCTAVRPVSQPPAAARCNCARMCMFARSLLVTSALPYHASVMPASITFTCIKARSWAQVSWAQPRLVTLEQGGWNERRGIYVSTCGVFTKAHVDAWVLRQP